MGSFWKTADAQKKKKSKIWLEKKRESRTTACTVDFWGLCFFIFLPWELISGVQFHKNESNVHSAVAALWSNFSLFPFPSSHDVSAQWQYSINTAKTTETDYQSISRLTISKENILSGTVKCWEKKLKTLSNNEIKTTQRAPDDCHNKHSPLWRLMGNWYMVEMLPLPTWCDIPAAFPTRTPGTEI